MGDLPVAALIDHRCVFGMRAGPEGLPDTSKLSYRSGIGDGKGIFQVSGTRNIELDTLRRNPRLRAMEVVAESGKTGPLYVVGGYLRDLLLGRIRARRADLDVVIWGEPERFGRDLVTAVKGSLVRLDPETVRVITQSAEGIVQIDISRPKGETIEDDLAARDFTVNALAVRLDTLDALSLIDPTGGLDDLRKKCLRVITPSAFDCDPLRLIRAVRLAAELGFAIDEATGRWIIERAPLLGTVAGERLCDELFRILDTVPAAPWIEQLDTLQLLRVLVPEVEALKSVPASRPHRLPLWEHSLQTLWSVELLLTNLERLFPDEAVWLRERLDREIEAGVTETAILKLLACLHDVGKPETRSVQPDGRVRFLGHEQAGLPILARLCDRLRLGRPATNLVAGIEQHHLRPIHLASATTVTARAQYRFFREGGDAAPLALLHSWADLRATIDEEADAFSRHQRFLREAFRFYRTEFLASQTEPFIRGDDLITLFGITPGPFLGFVLDHLQEAQATGVIASRQEAQVYIREHLLSWQQFFETASASRRSSIESTSIESN
ncbi:Multifunctional CCA protein [Candidatus Methylomirabilis lanthanidiphila]|uniref:Multifunctional CCA protein n=1 Tax=Candidatus Methylomirabilis lanthanidiphila TaxID=2211376 RepID=A0A564ZMG0_9BACT|nr:Multifunctional CCA protein [Candidatus Methylomirabilis lanthanidiphila]